MDRLDSNIAHLTVSHIDFFCQHENGRPFTPDFVQLLFHPNLVLSRLSLDYHFRRTLETAGIPPSAERVPMTRGRLAYTAN